MKLRVCIAVLLLFNINFLFGQSASISPSRFYFKQSPGGSSTQLLRVTNNGTRSETFQVTFSNFSSEGNKGKTAVVDDNYEHGCASWLTASPAFFEVAAGETKDVEIRIQVPAIPEANSVRWAVGNVRLATERTAIEERGADVTGMQIIQTFQFLFHIFQTPPVLQDLKEASVVSFSEVAAVNEQRRLRIEVKNTGKAIVDCVPYLDLVNTSTGDSRRVLGRPFSVLPAGNREVFIELPEDLEPGNYSILGVIDYGSSTDLAGAELNLVF
jgi:hypothetical protein